MKKTFLLLLTLCMALSMFAVPAYAGHSADTVLTTIELLAREGGIINCDFLAGDCTIDEIKNELGAPHSETYVKSAKGTYCEFKSHRVVAGYGKGDLVFELRSYSKRLEGITEKDVLNYFGEADHTSTSNGQKMLSYVVNDDYNLKFVFDSGNGNPLNHYNVIWLEGTGNSMADEAKRDW